MKLKVNQIQFLDFLLKRMQSKGSNFLSSNEKLSLVIDIDGNLWTGDFINYSDCKIQNLSLEYDGDFTPNEIDFISIITASNVDFFKRLNFNSKFRNINTSNLYILLNELFEIIHKIDCSNLKSDSIIFNAENLYYNYKLPFMCINDNVDYDVVSLIVLTKN